MTKNYLNLTNGIEYIPTLNNNYSFIRIQSTMCEQKNWDRIIQELDYDFLMNLAIGNECIIYDCGARKEIPRAIYQGSEFIKYVLFKRWYGVEYKTDISRTNKEHKRKNCNKYFEKCYHNLDDKTKKKLDYFKPYLYGDIYLKTVSKSTSKDGDKEYYKEILGATYEKQI